MKNSFIAVIAALSFASVSPLLSGVEGPWRSERSVAHLSTRKTDVEFWLTKPDQSVLFKKQSGSLLFASAAATGSNTIEVDAAKIFQTIDGFGYCLTGGSASLINSLPAAEQNKLLHELFGKDEAGIGVSYLRISIGASDLSSTTFTYDDVPDGETDP